MKLEEIKTLGIDGINTRLAAIDEEKNAEGADLAALTEEVRNLSDRKKELEEAEEQRKSLAAQVAAGQAGKTMKNVVPVIAENEKRAKDFAASHRLVTRALLSTGTIAKPTNVSGISGLAEVASGIVDDVNAVMLTGVGAWRAAYKDTDAVAAEVTDGSAIAGTASTYKYVDINPSEWGVLDEISNQVAKLSPLAYMSAIENSSLIALRAFAANKIVTALAASTLTQAETYALNENYLRSLLLGFRSISGKGAVKLYLAQADLGTLGAVRGSDKKAVYEIVFDANSTASGVIKEGGLACAFRVLDNLAAGTQYFGQPGTIDMPMWDEYTVETDAGGEYFTRNMVGIRGLQTAGADLVAKHGMQKIANA